MTRLTVPEYLSLLERGVYGDRRVELREGWVVDRVTHGSLPSMLIMLISEWLFERRPKETAIRTQVPVQLLGSCPEPDIAVVRGATSDDADRIPSASDILLIIEVSDSTLNDGRIIKKGMYARAGVKEYWILNCEERQVEVYTSLSAAAKTPRRRKLTTYRSGQAIPVRVAGKKLGDLAVNDLFPPKK